MMITLICFNMLTLTSLPHFYFMSQILFHIVYNWRTANFGIQHVCSRLYNWSVMCRLSDGLSFLSSGWKGWQLLFEKNLYCVRICGFGIDIGRLLLISGNHCDATGGMRHCCMGQRSQRRCGGGSLVVFDVLPGRNLVGWRWLLFFAVYCYTVFYHRL